MRSNRQSGGTCGSRDSIARRCKPLYRQADARTQAVTFYSDRDRGNSVIDTSEAVRARHKDRDGLRAMCRGLHCALTLKGGAADRLQLLGQALKHVYGLEGEGQDAKKQARKRFHGAVADLEKAFKLVSVRDEATAVCMEVAFFRAVKIATSKFEGHGRAPLRSFDLDAANERFFNQTVF